MFTLHVVQSTIVHIRRFDGCYGACLVMTHLLRLEIMNRSGLDLRSIFKMIVYGYQIHRLDVINMMVSMFLLSSHGLITYLMIFFHFML